MGVEQIRKVWKFDLITEGKSLWVLKSKGGWGALSATSAKLFQKEGVGFTLASRGTKSSLKTTIKQKTAGLEGAFSRTPHPFGKKLPSSQPGSQ